MARKIPAFQDFLNPDPYIVHCVEYSTQIAWYILNKGILSSDNGYTSN